MNSWGSVGDFGVYDQQAFEVDDFVHTNRDLLICFAAGNEGKDGNADGRCRRRLRDAARHRQELSHRRRL